MGLVELLLIAIGLAMDAFAVSIGIGLSLRKVRLKHCLIAGLYFGIFQGAMPLIGYFLGQQFADVIVAYDHWVAFILLAIIGGKMIYEGLKKDDAQDVQRLDEPAQDVNLGFKKMLPLAIATSIDAMAVGVLFGLQDVPIVSAVLLIGLITLVLSMIAVKLGSVFGSRYKSRAEIAGGIILVLIGLKILLEHLEVIAF